jgi:hypothetical protein
VEPAARSDVRSTAGTRPTIVVPVRSMYDHRFPSTERSIFAFFSEVMVFGLVENRGGVLKRHVVRSTFSKMVPSMRVCSSVTPDIVAPVKSVSVSVLVSNTPSGMAAPLSFARVRSQTAVPRVKTALASLQPVKSAEVRFAP